MRVDSSARTEDSLSRRAGDMIVNALISQQPELTVRRRDLAAEEVPHITNETIAGFYTSKAEHSELMREATELSDQLIAELKGAQSVIITAPMYNFGVPSSLKAWIDQIVRINQTFAFDGAAFQGLVPVKDAYLAIAYGAQGYAENGPMSAMNFAEPYLASLLGFLGIATTKTFSIEGTTGDAEQVSATMKRLASEIDQTLRSVSASV
ncbi:MAG: NAD(P)H-dependent oxidoreductase [Pseudomonadota bacterium]